MKTKLAGVKWDVCGRHRGARSGVHVTINTKNNTMFLTAEAMAAAGNPEMVRVLYSAEHGSIALRPTSDGDDNTAFAVCQRQRVRGIGGTVWVSDLCSRLRTARMNGSFHIPMEWHPDGMLWGEIDQRIPTKRKSRAKGGAE